MDQEAYERWQLERYGNILGSKPGAEEPEPEDRISTQEQAYIYELENPE